MLKGLDASLPRVRYATLGFELYPFQGTNNKRNFKNASVRDFR
jgi:hypothetical protein